MIRSNISTESLLIKSLPARRPPIVLVKAIVIIVLFLYVNDVECSIYNFTETKSLSFVWLLDTDLIFTL